MANSRVSGLDQIADAARRSFSTMEDMVYSVIREAINTGVFQPGERLPQEHIAEVLGVSRMPVRASLRQLESEGLVEIRPYRGAIVRELSPAEVLELYEIRILLETFALRGVIERISDEECAQLSLMVDRLDSETEPSRWMEARRRFYRQLYAIADRPRLVKLIDDLRGEIGRFWMTVRLVHEPEGHTELVEAIRRRDADAAVEWLEHHLMVVCDKLRQLMEEREASEDTD